MNVPAFLCALLAGGAVAAQEPSWFAALVADDRVPAAIAALQALDDGARTRDCAAAMRLATAGSDERYERLLRVVVAFPSDAAALLPAVVAHERARAPSPQYPGSALTALLAAALPGALREGAEGAVALLAARTRFARAELPADRPALELLACAQLRAIELAEPTPESRVDRLASWLGRGAGPAAIFACRIAATDPQWPGVADRIRRGDVPGLRYGPLAGLRQAVFEHLAPDGKLVPMGAALWPSEPRAAMAWLVTEVAPDDVRTDAGHLLALASDDAVRRTRAASTVFSRPPGDLDVLFRSIVIRATARADDATRRACIAWLDPLPVARRRSEGLLRDFASWPAPLREEVRTRWGRSASLMDVYFEERALWPERLLAIGPDVGIQLVVQEIARLGEIARSPQRKEPGGGRAAASALLWGEWAALAARGGSAADFAAAVDEALRSPPAAPRGAVPRLCQVVLDLDAGDRQRARAILLALRDWPDGERGRRAFGPDPPVAITGARETWTALAAVAHQLGEIDPMLRGERSLCATLERAAATTGSVVVDPYFDGPWAGPTLPPAFGWSQGLLRGSRHLLIDRSDGKGRPLFGEVGARVVEIAGQPAFEFVLPAAPR